MPLDMNQHQYAVKAAKDQLNNAVFEAVIRLLAELGVYRGPEDSFNNERLQSAIEDYLR